MRKTVFAVLAATTMLSIGLLASSAAATTSDKTSDSASAATTSPATPAVTPVREAAVLCGTNGCSPVQTKPPQHRKFKPLGHG